MNTPEEMRAEGNRLAKESDRIRQEANRLYQEARKLEASLGAARLQVGMTVTLRSIPFEWVFAHAGIDGTTPLRVTKLGPKNATVEREDGGEFPFPRRNYRRVLVPRTDLKPP